MYEGTRAVIGGIAFVAATPAVWPWAMVPVLLLLILTCGLGALAVWGAGEASAAILGAPDGIWQQAGSWALYGVLILAGLFAAILLGLALAQPLSGFALEKIALAQERALGRTPTEVSFIASTYVSVQAALVTLPVVLFVLVPAFFLDMIFPPSMVVTVPLRFVIGSWLLAWNFLDYPLSLRGLGVRGRLRWAIERFEAVSVFGMLWALLLLVPGLYLLALPMGVAGAARLVVAGEKK